MLSGRIHCFWNPSPPGESISLGGSDQQRRRHSRDPHELDEGIKGVDALDGISCNFWGPGPFDDSYWHDLDLNMHSAWLLCGREVVDGPLGGQASVFATASGHGSGPVWPCASQLRPSSLAITGLVALRPHLGVATLVLEVARSS